ncbi:MAG: prepilin-type N-terminal cleavage/methylation domain-containing protein [Thermodesulfovibrionales bacterium]
MKSDKTQGNTPLSPPLLRGEVKGGVFAGHSAGFTLIELVIATTIILIVSLGFFGWASTIIQTNLSIERNNTAYTMAMDVAERLQRMSDNTLIQPRSGSSRCVGFDGSANLRGCNTTTSPPVTCSGGSPQVNLSSDATGLTILTNPWNGTANKLYLYDRNYCENKTWVDADCGDSGKVDITTGTDFPNIDHPNAAGSAYDSINPIRSYRNTTYYAVWSVAYMACNAGTNTDRRKIFVSVYWIDPEPTDTTTAGVQTKIQNGTAVVKSVSIVVDKTIGTES